MSDLEAAGPKQQRLRQDTGSWAPRKGGRLGRVGEKSKTDTLYRTRCSIILDVESYRLSSLGPGSCLFIGDVGANRHFAVGAIEDAFSGVETSQQTTKVLHALIGNVSWVIERQHPVTKWREPSAQQFTTVKRVVLPLANRAGRAGCSLEGLSTKGDEELGVRQGGEFSIETLGAGLKLSTRQPRPLWDGDSIDRQALCRAARLGAVAAGEVKGGAGRDVRFQHRPAQDPAACAHKGALLGQLIGSRAGAQDDELGGP